MRNITNTARFTRFSASLVALLVVLSVFGPVGTAAAQPTVSITQTAQAGTTVAPGETITLQATIDYAEVNSPAIDVTLPAGWSVIAHADDGGTYGPPEPAWLWLEGDADGVSGSHTVTYTVSVPADAAPGDYTISAEGSAIDPATGSFVTSTDEITVTVEEEQPENQPPTAAFSASPPAPEAGDSVSFDATGSTDPDGTIASYSWDFGDGSTGSGVTAAHTYSQAGTYAVTLTVTDDDGATDTATQQLVVSEPPAAGPGATEISITPNSGVEASTYGGGSYQIENTGEREIESVTFDLSTAALPDVVFDPQGTAGDQAGKDFTPDSGAGTVGLVVGTFSQPHNGANGSDGYDVLTITFDDFQPGESFAFSSDNDPTSIKAATVGSQEAGPISGLELSRATVTVEYADGSSQTTQLMGDGSEGGSQAALDSSVSEAPSIGVEGVSLDADVLDDYHSAATVAGADQTVTVSGPANADVTLLRIEAELELDDVPEYGGTPGYDIEAFEANHAEAVEYYSTTLDSDGTAEIPVTLTRSTEPDLATEAAGLNYLVAVIEDGADETGTASNVVVLKYDPDVVTNGPPEASFSASPTDPAVGETVSFDATGSTDSDGTIASYAWDFGDGDTDTGTTSAHVYDAAGTYTVTLTVTDDDGATDSTTQTIAVEEADQPTSIAEAVASLNENGDDSLIDTQELQQAIDLWVEDDPVPGTDGELISTQGLQSLIDAWVEDEPVGTENGGDN